MFNLTCTVAMDNKILDNKLNADSSNSKNTCPKDTDTINGKCYLKCKTNYIQYQEKCLEKCPVNYQDINGECLSTIKGKEIGEDIGKILSGNTAAIANVAGKEIGKFISGDTYDRGVGRIPDITCPSGWSKQGIGSAGWCKKDGSLNTQKATISCNPDESKDGLLCYNKCKDGFKEVGSLCARDKSIYKRDSYDNPSIKNIIELKN
jgi:hypothetical protein